MKGSKKIGGSKPKHNAKSSKNVDRTKLTNKKVIGNKVELWGGIIEYDEPIVSAQTKRMIAAVDVGLGRFEEHKTTFATILHQAYDKQRKFEPFDEAKVWSRLTSLARSFSWQAELKVQTTPAATRKQRLEELAKVLGRSRTVLDAAMRDDIGADLCSAWCDGTNEPLISLDRNRDGSIAAVRGPEESFKKALVDLAALAVAARHAANQVKRPGRRRPKGTAVLPAGYIEVLAALYREATGRKPGTGSAGPFVRFV